MDQITYKRIETVHPLLLEELKCIYSDINKAITSRYARMRFSHVLRTFKEQDDLFAQGRSKPGKIVTNARGGESYHNYGLAVDIVELLDLDKNGAFEKASWDLKLDADFDGIPDWDEVVAIFKRYGWEWGGNWKKPDSPHFQKTFGKSVQELRKMPTSHGYPNIFLVEKKICECCGSTLK